MKLLVCILVIITLVHLLIEQSLLYINGMTMRSLFPRNPLTLLRVCWLSCLTTLTIGLMASK